jgi:N-acetylneuraminic acid mutarotase
MRPVLLALLLCFGPRAAAEWSASAPLELARADAAAAVLGGRIYAAGGRSLWGTRASFAALDPERGEWRELAPLPAALFSTSLASAGGRVLAIGGYTDLCRNATREAWAWDPASGSWSALAPLPELRGEFAAAALEDSVYLVGGRGLLADRPWRYSAELGRWEIIPAPMRVPRYLLAAAALRGKLYAIGGRAAPDGDLASVERFDPRTEQWSSAADLPAPRAGLAAAVAGDRIHVFGGERMASGRVFADHWVYDPDADLWSEAEPLPLARRGQAAAALGGEIFLLGGTTRSGWFGALIGSSREVDVWRDGR